jgi:hypothetical protein
VEYGGLAKLSVCDSVLDEWECMRLVHDVAGELGQALVRPSELAQLDSSLVHHYRRHLAEALGALELV